MRRLATPVLGGARAVILHRPHPTVEALMRQLSAIGLLSAAQWPDLDPSALGANFVFFDVDRGHDAQFPWKPGEAPMPMIALIGSEAPGRIEWALSMGADAQLLKPVGDGGVYSALLIAHSAFVARRRLAAEVQGLRARLAERRTVLRAVLALAEGQGEEAGYAALRRRAMDWRVTVEEAAARILAACPDKEGGRHVRRRRPA
ncbi:Response regulator with putative antiterminator output domain protein [Rubellimicrobium thermophilum DSM 16684]|uniref:Response regulator with putative antiterminator output domain protein n=1 Tax=Rubellimicrobium thermophilum DSM 16684 TaxID=1123069 RepID=S9R783_9RHOB|nr:ANTAR domain-containing protein [Rubellimicrobium thermophilum]EPX87848.1 Response regulator with putative antiterminator output domain protein [Rubellimicrobium thermophilum DSM 16684]